MTLTFQKEVAEVSFSFFWPFYQSKIILHFYPPNECSKLITHRKTNKSSAKVGHVMRMTGITAGSL
jgi:hypothetical protein